MNMVQNISSKSMCCLSLSLLPKENKHQYRAAIRSQVFRGSGTVPAIACVLRQQKKLWGKWGIYLEASESNLNRYLGKQMIPRTDCPSLGLLPLYSGRIELALNALHHWKGDVISSSTKCNLQNFLLTSCEPAQSNGKGTKEGSGTLHFTHV